MGFHKVDAKQAGANALGILVPHGAKTLVIVRPRALPWDLLPARWEGDGTQPPQFCVFTRDEAAAAARRLLHALEDAVKRGVNPVQTFGSTAELQIWLRTDELVWIACRRAPGQAYQPMLWLSSDEAIAEAERIAAIVWPSATTRQEYYFNTQSFTV